MSDGLSWISIPSGQRRQWSSPEEQIAWLQARVESMQQLYAERERILGGHTAVVWVVGEAACIALTHVQVQEPVELLEFHDTCCGDCGPGLCYVDQMTGA